MKEKKMYIYVLCYPKCKHAFNFKNMQLNKQHDGSEIYVK